MKFPLWALIILASAPHLAHADYLGDDEPYDPKKYSANERTKRKIGEKRKSCWALYNAVEIPGQKARQKLLDMKLAKSKDTEDLQARWKDARLYDKDGLHGQNNDATDFLRFIRMDDYAKAPTRVHGVEVYGVDNYVAWKRADEYLKSIPKGSFDPTLELMSKTHELGSAGLNPWLKKIERFVPEGYLPSKGGVMKKRDSVGKNPIHTPLTEEQHQAIVQNPWLKGFIELPVGSKPGARRGWIHYATAADTPKKLEELRQWYLANKDTMDPIELAARFQHAFVSIHPYVDGNGRASRLLMDRILAEHGLPPAILRDSNNDILVPVEQYVKDVREGVERYLTLGDRTSFPGSVPRNDSDDGLHMAESLAEARKALSGLKEISFGGKRFQMSFNDGFLYDAAGIPHVFHEGTVYPISDRAYRLLEMNVPVEIKRVWKRYEWMDDPKQGYWNEEVVAGISPDQLKYAKSNSDLLKAISEGKVKQADVKLHPYDSIDKANRERKVFLHPWQKDLFANAARIDATEPAKMLMPFRKGKTQFDTNLEQQKVPTQILAQYNMVDLYYRDLLETAEKQFPELVGQVQESRRKIHKAARELLEPAMKEYEKLSPAAKEAADGTFAKKLFDTYMKRTKLGHEDFDEALKLEKKDTVVLMRSDSTFVNKTGFLSHSHVANAFKKLPGSKKMHDMLERLQAFMASPEGKRRIEAWMKVTKKKAEKGQGIYKILPKSITDIAKDLETYYPKFEQAVTYAVNTILKNQYDMHSAGPEFERAFLMDLAHAGGGGLKDSKSFTTNTNLMESFPFVSAGYGDKSELVQAQISFVEMPRDAAHIQFGSDSFTNEYEILVDKPIGPWKIEEAFEKKGLKQSMPTGYSKHTWDPTTGKSEKIEFTPEEKHLEAGEYMNKFFHQEYWWLNQHKALEKTKKEQELFKAQEAAGQPVG